MSARPSMVISPFASLAAGEARSASAPMVGEACVLTDQEIEVWAAQHAGTPHCMHTSAWCCCVAVQTQRACVTLQQLGRASAPTLSVRGCPILNSRWQLGSLPTAISMVSTEEVMDTVTWPQVAEQDWHL